MAFIGVMKNFILQLKLMNYAEALDIKPRHHVNQISFIVTILEDEGGTDEILDYERPLSVEDQEMLKWQPRTENCQNDSELRNTLTNVSGKLCPYKSIAFSLFWKVTDYDTHQQRVEPQPLSSYRHVSFRSVMLTKHSVPNEQVQLMFSCDGLPDDRSCLRWRSHDFIKLVLCEARLSYRVFWLVQWDVVDMSDCINQGIVGTGPETFFFSGNHLRPSTKKRHSDHSRKFVGTRHRMHRKSPWSAEVRPKGSKNKISLGSYQTRAEAARAVDAGLYYHNLKFGKLNFPDSKRFLAEIPADLNERGKKDFVFKQAHQLAKLAEKPPSTGISESRSCNTNSEKFASWSISCDNNFGAYNSGPATNASFASLPIAGPVVCVTPSVDSVRDLPANLVDVRPSTSYSSGTLRKAVARSSPVESFLLSTSNDWFTANSFVRAGDFYPGLGLTCTHEAPLAPVRNCGVVEATNGVFKIHDPSWDANAEQDILDDSARIKVSDIPSAGVSDSNHLGLHHEINSQSTKLTSPEYDFNPLIGGSEQTESNGSFGRDMDVSDWLGFFRSEIEDINFENISHG